jgi:hypothetical protein
MRESADAVTLTDLSSQTPSESARLEAR